MGWFKAIWSEFIGLFVDDGLLAVVILVWIGAAWLLLPRLGLPADWLSSILFIGLAVILLESAVRRARQGP